MLGLVWSVGFAMAEWMDGREKGETHVKGVV